MSTHLTRITVLALCLLTCAATTSAQSIRLVKDIVSGRVSGSPSFLTEVGGVFVFVAYHTASGRELWVTDGTNKGTKLLKDIRKGSLSSHPGVFVTLAGKVYFLADDGIHGQELWVTDGTVAGTKLVADVYPGATSSRIYILAVGSKRIWFMAELLPMTAM